MYNSLFSLCHDNAFYWVRFSTLEKQLCKKQNIKLAKLLATNNVPFNCCFIINRFSYSLFFRALLTLFAKLKIPYIFDIDDLYWNLPAGSTDLACTDTNYKNFIDYAIANAVLVTTTNEFLASELKTRFSGVCDIKIKVVPNAVPNWCSPSRDGVLVANTDAFKLNAKDSSWYQDLFVELYNNGIPVQFIGNNQGAVKFEDELKFYYLDAVSYRDYLLLLNSGKFKFGLIPVSESEYADAKSDIKLQEFLEAGIRVYASKIRPYKDYAEVSNVVLVENTKEAWESCIKEIIQLSAKEEEHKALQKPHSQARVIQRREAQLLAWEEAITDLLKNAAPTNLLANRLKYIVIRIFFTFYLSYFVRIKNAINSWIAPLRTLVRHQNLLVI